jgi:hypothetical protein
MDVVIDEYDQFKEPWRSMTSREIMAQLEQMAKDYLAAHPEIMEAVRAKFPGPAGYPIQERP